MRALFFYGLFGFSFFMIYFVDMMLAGFSALLLILAFPDYEMQYLVWIALVPLFLIIKKSGCRRSFLFSLIVGFIFFCVLEWWVLTIDRFNLINFSLANLVNAFSIGIFGFLACLFQNRIPRWNILLFPSLWIATEYIRSNMGFLSWPWGILGYSQYTVLPVARLSAYTGIYGISFIITAVNVFVAELVHSVFLSPVRMDSRTQSLWNGQMISFSVLITFLILFSSFIFYGINPKTDNPISQNLKVALIQGGNMPGEKRDALFRNKVLTKYAELTKEALQHSPDLIVWSSVVLAVLPNNEKVLLKLMKLASESEAYLLFGSAGHDKFDREQRKKQKFSNSAFLLTPRYRIKGRYDKIMLLPFDEYLPLRGKITWPSWIVPANITGFLPGTKLSVFSMKNIRFGVQICWENLFPGQFRKLAREAHFMVSMINEDFTDVPAAHHQTLAMNVFRAIENNRSIVRAATTGVSSIIGPNGRIIASVRDSDLNDVNVEGYVVVQVPLSSETTFYSRYGDCFIYATFILLGIFFVWCGITDIQKRMKQN